MKKFGVVLAVAVLVLSVFSLASAQDPMARPAMPGKIVPHGDGGKPQIPPAQNVVPDLKGLLMAPPKINVQGLHLDDKLVKIPLPNIFKSMGFYDGHWENIDPNTNSIKYLFIGGQASNAVMRVWGVCHPTPCDWGQVKASAHTFSVTGNANSIALAVTAPFNHGFCQRFVIVEPSGANIKVTVYNNYNDGRSDTVFTATMKKLPF